MAYPLTQQAETLSELLTEPEEELPMQWQAFRTAFAQYEPLMRSYLANEVYSELLSFEDTTKHMLVRLQWLMLQYAAVRQSLFLIWQDSPEAFPMKSAGSAGHYQPYDRL